MFDIGFLELMVVAVLGLLVLGPERLPKAARSLGLIIGKVRRTMSNIQDDLERHARTEELREKLKDPYATFMDADEQQAQANSAADAEQPEPPREASSPSSSPTQTRVNNDTESL